MNAATPRVIFESVSSPSSGSPVETIPVAITSAPAAGWAQWRVRPSPPVCSVTAEAERVPGGIEHDPVPSLVAVGGLMGSHAATGRSDLGYCRVQVGD
jgi:hypothetical protein